MNGVPPLLSIIIPAHNEEHRLPGSLNKVLSFLQYQPYQAEVLVVENGSQDRTAEIALRFTERYPNLYLLREPKPGKGLAVRRGMLEAKGEYRFICDADLSMPIDEVNRFIPPQLHDFDIAIASREIPGSARYGEPLYRHWIGRGFNLLVRTLTVPQIQDTQCGFKCFRALVAEDLFNTQILDGWTFDVEVLFIALKRGYEITEIPIPWYYIPGSRVHFLRDSLAMFSDLFRIRGNWRRGLYGPPG
ncbi:MAG: glycosyltransferase family 2 protein [Anaerolineales bacterium]|nr:MAG: glycosyltransferase family 2 protein [Anaerolineales bacterium]